jgi:hypothetical protein
MSLTCCLSQEKAIPESVARAVSDLRAACPMKKEEQESVALAVSDKSLYWRVLPELSLTCYLSQEQGTIGECCLTCLWPADCPRKKALLKSVV